MDITLVTVSIICLVVLLLIVLLKRFRQPYLIAYMTAGIALRPLLDRMRAGAHQIETIGEMGLLLLMLFIGMEMHIPNKRSLLIKPVIAQLAKTALSVAFAFLIGNMIHLSTAHSIVLSMLFVFNSTPIVSDYLQRNNQLHSAFGIIILNVLLLQDILLTPALTILRFISSGKVNLWSLTGAVIACLIVVLLLKSIRNERMVHVEFFSVFKEDHDLQIFLGLSLCLGFGVLAELAGLTSSIGSFIAGILIGRTPALHWLERSLNPLRVFFVAFFFMSIGLQQDISYIITHPLLILAVTGLVLLSNSVLSALVFRALGFNWTDSFHAGALLAHTGEFGILACSLAHSIGLIDTYFFKVAIAITGVSLLLSTAWIQVHQNIFKSIGRSNELLRTSMGQGPRRL